GRRRAGSRRVIPIRLLDSTFPVGCFYLARSRFGRRGRPTTRESTHMPPDPERERLLEHGAAKANWKRWGPYLSERAWGTVREDYSADGDAWNYFPHDHARSRAYRWNEDGLGGFCDDRQHICLAVALWNEKDAILKERMFGLSNQQGNHGEDVKEYYFFLDG